MHIIIPTYWGRPTGEADDIFDHPTPIDGNSTLPRLLESLAALDADSPPFQVLILVATVHHDIDAAALARVQAMIADYAYPVDAFGGDVLRRWQMILQTDVLGMADLMPYPGKLIQATDAQIHAALSALYTPDMPMTPDEVIETAYAHAEHNVPRYAAFVQAWQALCARADQDSVLRQVLLNATT